MPLLTSPIDGSPMRQIHRYGIEIDVCPTTGGIWLDKGELEKLMALIKEEVSGHDERPVHHQSHKGQTYRKYDDDDDDDYKKYGYKKKSKMSKMMDIFDF